MKTNNKKVAAKGRLIDYEEILLEELKDPAVAIDYLNATLLEKDPRVFLLALRQVLEAHGQSMSVVARKSKIDRESLDRMFASKKNPKLDSLMPVLSAIGFHLAILPGK